MTILMKRILSSILYLALIAFPLVCSGQVEIHEDSIIIPTYVPGDPSPMPRFYEGTTHQGVQRRIYPYPMNDMLVDTKEDRTYPIIRLENEFIELGIMPSLGGRIYYAVDKTNGYNWFYRNHVIKPSLIGMVGFWISGSLAWGFPHHHGPNTVKPMDYSLEEHADGSRTVWISNTDRRHRMSILIGYTVYPHSSIVEMTIRPFNRTAVANSFLFWANPSVHVDTTYEVIFPPSVQYVTQHAKREMTTWPIADGRYNNFDYTEVDISMWKNIGVPSSFFSWDPKEDYFGGYNHGKQAGTAWVGNHYIMPGMKFWAWGNNPAGDQSNSRLTDDDGHYIELMAGMYTDNQPDYSWIQPYEVKSGQMVWFPIRELGGLKYACRDGALNLELTGEGSASLSINTTSPHQQARAIVRAGDRVLFDRSIDISPAHPFAATVPVGQGITEDDLEVLLETADAQQLLYYRPADHHPPKEPKPRALERPADPVDIGTVEELYLTGLRLEQFYNASIDPMPYYQEALRRDPGNSSVNIQLGIRALKDLDWAGAESRFRIAADRVSANYTRPRDGEGFYYLGIAQRALGEDDCAYDNLYRATWSEAWHSAAYYNLSEIDCRRGDFQQALNHIDRSLVTNSENEEAVNLNIILLRKTGQADRAELLARTLLAKDPLNHGALNEWYLVLRQTGDVSGAEQVLERLTRCMRDEVQSYLELATDYGSCGLFGEAAELLSRLEKKGESFPMLYYYLGYYREMLGDREGALHYFREAASKPHDYCFPFRGESLDVLEMAMELNPGDARAPYYLGNLLYEHQPERAIALWEHSRDLDPSFYIVHRNLGLAYREIREDNLKAMESMEEAVRCNPGDPRLLFELDNIYALNRVSPEKKYEMLRTNIETAEKRSETLLRLATRAVEYGAYDEAIDILENHQFPQFEGGREMQDSYLNAYSLRGMERLDSGELQDALADFSTALEYPVGRFGRSRWAQFYCLMGETCTRLGEKVLATEYFKQAIRTDIQDRGSDREYLYYRGLALKNTGQKKEAKELFEKMLEDATRESGRDFFTQFEGGQAREFTLASNHYQAGLAHLGLGDREKAKAEFQQALELNPGHVWSKALLDRIAP
jgi:tetratricopeptide (TPR) repeat protein